MSEDRQLDSTMPGHLIESAHFKDKDAFNRNRCPKCNLLLKDPVQPSCGHRICMSCAEDIIAEHSSPLCPQADCREPFDNEDGAYVSSIPNLRARSEPPRRGERVLSGHPESLISAR